MDLAFCSFSSGSSGNCYLLKSDTTNILIEAGITGSRIYENFQIFGMSPRRLHGVVVSHEHFDHIKGLNRVTADAIYAVCCATEGTFEAIGDRARHIAPDKRKIVHSGDSFMIGDIQVGVFALSHDAVDPVGYSFEKNGKKITVVTDTGCVTEEIREAIKDSDLLVIEANHEKNILLYGKYPYNLKRRILSDKGHLSNEDAGRCICDFMNTRKKPGVPRVLLAHLSQENNTPLQAKITVRNILEEAGYYVGKDLLLDTLEKGVVTDLIPV